MEYKTVIRKIGISPKKLRFLVSDVKKYSPQEAMDRLLYNPTISAKILLKAIKSAVSSAEKNSKADPKSLKFKTLSVDGGQFLKRFRAGGRGVAKPFKRRSSHINIVLTGNLWDKK